MFSSAFSFHFPGIGISFSSSFLFYFLEWTTAICIVSLAWHVVDSINESPKIIWLQANAVGWAAPQKCIHHEQLRTEWGSVILQNSDIALVPYGIDLCSSWDSLQFKKININYLRRLKIQHWTDISMVISILSSFDNACLELYSQTNKIYPLLMGVIIHQETSYDAAVGNNSTREVHGYWT